MKFLHSMIRVTDLDESLRFFCDILGLEELRRNDYPEWKCTLVYLKAPENKEAEIELTYNWEPEEYENGTNFGHLAFEVENIYEVCQRVMDAGITINRPPRHGSMAFFKTPDGISIELLQRGESFPDQEPWLSMENIGSW